MARQQQQKILLSDTAAWDLISGKRAALVDLLPVMLRNNVDFYIKVAYAEVKKSRGLRECEPETIVATVINAARLGLPLDSILGQAYMVPFWSGSRKVKECTLIIGYKGYITLALQSGVRALWAKNVIGDCTFEVYEGTEPRIVHVPNRPNVGSFHEAYAVAVMKHGDKIFEVAEQDYLDELKREQLDRIRDDYARKNSPWEKNEAAMRRKTPVRILSNFLPLAPESPLAMAARLDAQADLDELQTVDTTAVVHPENGARSEKRDPLKDAAAKTAGTRQPGEEFTEEEKAEIERKEREEWEQAQRQDAQTDSDSPTNLF